jgi:hypothetical protein
MKLPPIVRGSPVRNSLIIVRPRSEIRRNLLRELQLFDVDHNRQSAVRIENRIDLLSVFLHAHLSIW